MSEIWPLTYGLAPSVRHYPLLNGKIALVMPFPLKVATLHAVWRPIVEGMARDAMPLQEMAQLSPRQPLNRIEMFMNRLLMKGFLSITGIRELSSGQYPAVSIIIPVRNRPHDIGACLDSLTRIAYPPEKLDIIVVDDASEDSTPEVVARFPMARLVRLETHRQVSFCRNLGVQQASGELLAFIDSDCTATPLWLKALTPAFQEPSVGAVGGLVDAACEDNGLDRYEKVKSSLSMGASFRRSDSGDRFFYVPTCNFLVRRELFLKLGGFQESLHLGEDVDFCWRLQDDGALLEYRPVGPVFHRHRNQLYHFFHRRFEYGTSEPMLQTLHPDRIKTFYVPVFESLFWTLWISGVCIRTPLLPAGAVVVWATTCLNSVRTLRKAGIPLDVRTIAVSTTRSYLSFGYRCCSFVSRYYLIMGLALAPFLHLVGGLIIAMHILTGVVDYVALRPRQSALSFLFYFSVEQIAYQAGVWRGCFRHRNFRPVFPKITGNLGGFATSFFGWIRKRFTDRTGNPVL